MDEMWENNWKKSGVGILPFPYSRKSNIYYGVDYLDILPKRYTSHSHHNPYIFYLKKILLLTI